MPGDGKAPERGLSARGLSAHILPTSATMVGVCMTVLSIGHLAPRGDMRVAIDKLLAVDAIGHGAPAPVAAEDAAATIRLIELALQSAAEGRVLKVS